ncbi:peptidoglycan recognition protein family protein [Sphingomonas sanxanigenens]|uniref:N-acetylmuramoyl-L-alanine amidase n=1 Tax=Sphingomonas sanxanigenens DSM 19645 = NX02 TaxID=1123269 RepID=W0AHK3_9SPHN|nr:N-acetylmuramoyl-L-alanine amidase [Sphingomonas sanxanigenens]AHE55997.1 hypothetical protein NX02_21835 [Sphingomonas sanxanigenens DSM 19645 = NX02]
MPNATWLADVLRGAGLKVEERPAWKTRGTGELGTVRGVLCHHTAGGLKGNAPSLSLVENGRPDLRGPLSQLVLGRDGTFYVVAAGRANHAGAGAWQGVTAGNSSLIGIEAENRGDGSEPWPEIQLDAYARGCAAILKHIGAPVTMCAGHKEYATPRGRKIDPSFDMQAFRSRVSAAMAGTTPPAAPVATVDPVLAMLKRGDRGDDVRKLQDELGISADGVFGPATEAAVIAFQKANGLGADGIVGPKTWKALL